FGHHLYPAGDPRASALLARILQQRPDWQALVEQAFDLVGQRPSVDFALVAVRRHLGLPPGAAFGLFALGRSIGWLAHGLEQRGSQDLIRPRAAYTGVHPDAA
ncbi:citrate/2-methylcitrate synthase, partial [Achromobacter insuavis]|uniref:citrate/2-methylcitrate synthase n=1 Tax=Achromobacter insuavis TaxID=1287735 RepID=UPI0035A03D4B